MTDPTALILIVDDDDAARFVKVQTLRRAGFDVREATTGQDALRSATDLSPDVVVLDVNLPDVSGLEVARRLRGQVSLPSIPIVQVSSTAVTTADRIRGLEQGADVYLTEPVESEILVATVRALLRVRRAEEALAAALDRERLARNVAEEANRLKDDFIATLSHELRTPLNALMGWIWQLRHSTLEEEARSRALDSLERNARMQAQLINDLLDISRISKGKLHLRMQFVDLRAIVDSAVDSVRETASRKHLQLMVSGEACCVAADQARLQQVLTNLLTNAVQFTPERGGIEVTLAVENGSAVVRVRDTGEGIDPAFLPHVFDPFRQGEGGLSRKHGGLGLGLSVVRQLVDLHGGTVEVWSAGPGRGTTFTVTIPVEQEPASDSQTALLLDDVNVLVVHRAALDLASILEASGARVVAVTSAAAAEELRRSQTFDVIVADTEAMSEVPIDLPIVAASSVSSAGQLVRDVMRVRRRPQPHAAS